VEKAGIVFEVLKEKKHKFGRGMFSTVFLRQGYYTHVHARTTINTVLVFVQLYQLYGCVSDL
jgi:hypothetical protein